MPTYIQCYVIRGLKEPSAHGATVPLGHGATVPLGHGATVPFGHRSAVPLGHGAIAKPASSTVQERLLTFCKHFTLPLGRNGRFFCSPIGTIQPLTVRVPQTRPDLPNPSLSRRFDSSTICRPTELRLEC